MTSPGPTLDPSPPAGPDLTVYYDGACPLRSREIAALIADLRTDHAGETGAVMIYRGILATSRDAGVRRFATRHLSTESRHLELVGAVLAPVDRSRLLPVWRLAGWITGALPGLAGPRAVYATVEAVERFVDTHYAEQTARVDALDPARADARLQSLRRLLERCRLEEVEHRDEAALARMRLPRSGSFVRLREAVVSAWAHLVAAGSASAVRASRRI